MKYQAKINLSNKNNAHTLTFEKIQEHACGLKLKVLEAGCSSGYFGSALADEGHEVWGVEPFEEAAAKAKEVLHYVHVGFIQEFFLQNKEIRFDVIVFGDVLEHLTDPVDVLKQAAEFLNENGIVVASIPNVAHIAIRAMMLEGRWDYSDLGILDRTHLRFFTRNTLVDLFSESNYEVLSLNAVRLSAEQVDELCNLNIKKESIKFAKDCAFDARGYDFQYIVSAQPSQHLDSIQKVNAVIKHEEGVRVLCLVHDPSSSIVDIRLRNPLKRWASSFGGHVKVTSIFESDSADLTWADVIVFQRDAGEYVANLTAHLQSREKKVIFEIDDLLTQLPPFLSHHNEAIDQLLPYINKVLATADAISVSSNELASKFNLKNKNIYLTPNYSEKIGLKASHFDVHSTQVKLIVASSDKVLVDMLIAPLLKLQDELGVQVVGIGPPGDMLEKAGVKVIKHKNFSHIDFKNFIASIDNGIGVIPLDSSEFSSCKTAVKYFDYCLSGVPSICSNVLPYSVVIENEVTGILVENTLEAWSEALRKLIASFELRVRLTEAAIANVEQRHNLDLSSQSWQQLINSLNILPRLADADNVKMIPMRKGYGTILKIATRHAFKPSSYLKALRTLRRFGVKGLYERVMRT
jgi:2-polyprenyl-3-methyl-5-hydroxy-6-metoxy-1,4-benzoquinol methylase/glycosyltransferase involved in cell wall biosynthesis